MDTPTITPPPPSEMELLLHDASIPKLPAVGDIVTCKVITVAKYEVILDIDGITTGVVRGKELVDESGMTADLKVGQTVEATVLDLENEQGHMELSFRAAGHQKAWDELIRMMNTGEVVEARITDANRGGLMVTVGRIEGFLPVSQLTSEHYPRVEGGDKVRILEHLRQYVSQPFRVKVIDVGEAEDRLIVSEKAAWAKEHASIVAGYTVGDVIKGNVTGVVDFGAFVEFGEHLEGLIHISEMAWQRVDNPRDILKVGDSTEAMIIAIDGTKISLSLKRLKDDPWKKAVEKYSIGQIVEGKVLKLNPFGAFVELDEEIHGLAHISELSSKQVKNAADVLKGGETRKFRIISIDPDAHRLGLSIKALEEEAPPMTAEGERVSDPALAGISLDDEPEKKAEEKTDELVGEAKAEDAPVAETPKTDEPA